MAARGRYRCFDRRFRARDPAPLARESRRGRREEVCATRDSRARPGRLCVRVRARLSGLSGAGPTELSLSRGSRRCASVNSWPIRPIEDAITVLTDPHFKAAAQPSGADPVRVNPTPTQNLPRERGATVDEAEELINEALQRVGGLEGERGAPILPRDLSTGPYTGGRRAVLVPASALSDYGPAVAESRF